MSDYDWTLRQAELDAIPPKKANFSEWPKGVRAIGVVEMDALGVDAQEMSYWHGRPMHFVELNSADGNSGLHFLRR